MLQWARYLIVFFLGWLTAIIASQPLPKQTVISERAASTSKVSRVIDGDTIELTDRRRVRYVGMDTPELGDNRKQVECFAIEAMEENKRLVEGKTVRLEKDVSETDRYGRLLRYVYIDSPAGEFVNDYLVRQGFARVDTVPPDVKFQQQFFEAQREAMEEGRGLWGGKCVFSDGHVSGK